MSKNNILIKEKNCQGHRAFDISKNEKCKSWFRAKLKRDDNKLKVLNKLMIKAGKKPFAKLEDAKDTDVSSFLSFKKGEKSNKEELKDNKDLSNDEEMNQSSPKKSKDSPIKQKSTLQD